MFMIDVILHHVRRIKQPRRLLDLPKPRKEFTFRVTFIIRVRRANTTSVRKCLRTQDTLLVTPLSYNSAAGTPAFM